MPAFSPPASLLCVLLCMSAALQRSDLHLAYVTPTSFYLYSCSQEPPPCSTASLSDCRCKDVQLPTPLRLKRLTVWFTSPPKAARLLNNSVVRHLTLVYCDHPGGARGTPSLPPEGHFAVQHLERLTVISQPHRPVQPCPDANNARNTDSNADPERDNGVYLDRNRFNRDRDTNLDLIMDLKKDALSLTPSQIQDIYLGRELGAAYHEQARLGIIHRSVLESGAEVKAYTVQTHIDSDGTLPFPDLHLPKLSEASVIYVSFVY
ncbi:unnamed protein product [Ophioblennius macclurei]